MAGRKYSNTELPIEVRLRSGSKDNAATKRIQGNNVVSRGSELAESYGPYSGERYTNRAIGAVTRALGNTNHASAVSSGIKADKTKKARE
jgi:hypothetical protein